MKLNTESQRSLLRELPDILLDLTWNKLVPYFGSMYCIAKRRDGNSAGLDLSGIAPRSVYCIDWKKIGQSIWPDLTWLAPIWWGGQATPKLVQAATPVCANNLPHQSSSEISNTNIYLQVPRRIWSIWDTNQLGRNKFIALHKRFSDELPVWAFQRWLPGYSRQPLELPR